MISRSLATLGLFLGDPADFLTADSFNEEGYWENAKIARFNDRLMIHTGMGDNPAAFLPDDWRDYRLSESDLAEARGILESCYQGQPLWGWKDPRTSQLVPFWNHVLNDAGVRPRYVIAVRHPQSVAQSLWKRDAFPKSMALGIWLASTLGSMKSSEGYERSVVIYEEFLETPVEALRRATECWLAEPWKDQTIVDSIAGIPNRRLNHSQSEPEPMPAIVQRVWDYAQRVAKKGILSADESDEELGALWKEFREWWSLIPLGQGNFSRLQLRFPGGSAETTFRASFKPQAVSLQFGCPPKSVVEGEFVYGGASVWADDATIRGGDGESIAVELKPGPETRISEADGSWAVVPPTPHFFFEAPAFAGPYELHLKLSVNDSHAEMLRLIGHLGRTRRSLLERLISMGVVRG